MPTDISKVAELFSATTFRQLAAGCSPTFVRAQISSAGGGAGLGRKMRLRLIYERAYQFLMEHYRFEYVYKNEITEQLLLRHHNLGLGDNSARLLSEFTVGNARVDVAIVNGTSTAYEIKTDYDSFDRLPHQIESYSRIFDHIYVVASESMVSALAARVPEHVGIKLLGSDGGLVENKPALSNKMNIDLRSTFLSMRESEVVAIGQEQFGIDSHLRTAESIRACWRHFRQLAPQQAHDHMVNMLKRRKIHSAHAELIKQAPNSLKHHAVSRVMNVNHWRMLANQFDVVV